MTQSDKANLFKSLHVKGTPLVLYNIWDEGSAKAYANAGADGFFVPGLTVLRLGRKSPCRCMR